MNSYYDYSNHLVYGIQSDTVRFIWAGFYIAVFLSSIIGDPAILVASIRYNAFRLNFVLVVIMQYIAVHDLILAVAAPFTRAVSIIAEKWVFGEYLCVFNVYINYHSLCASNLLISALTTSKAVMLTCPLQTRIWTRNLRKGHHMICLIIWIISLTVPILFFIIDKDDVYVDYRSYTCAYGYSADAWKFLLPMTAAIFSFIPFITIIVTTIPCLKFLLEARDVARRSRGSVRWQGVLTVVFTAAVYCISILPITVYYIAAQHVVEEPPGLFYIYFYRIGASFTTLNIMCNFYIYSLTVTSFREFLRDRSRLIVSYFSCSVSDQVAPNALMYLPSNQGSILRLSF